jgi:opacity protein-like surface antigen
MRSKLALSALVIASLFGATAIASAQTQSTTGASSEGNVGPDTSKMKSTNTKPDKMKSSKAKSGTTTGMSSGSKKGSAAPAGDNE